MPTFIPGTLADTAYPLGRFLPPIPQGVIAAWLAENVPPGAWVIDPFCAAPAVAIEAARAGYRVLAAANNPIERFLLELFCNPPSNSDLRATLADLAALPKGNERIEPYIESLYRTQCLECGAVIQADGFIWERQGTSPAARTATCPICKDSGERPSGPYDQQLAAQFSAKGLHWYRALERVAPMHDPDRSHAEDAMSVYLPRSVDAIFTIINKLDSLPADKRKLAHALLLPVFDQANTLWPHPAVRSRPRQLTQLSRFREKNIWLALEEAVDLWTAAFQSIHAGAESIPLVIFPNQAPQSGGITVYEGKLKDLLVEMQDPESTWNAAGTNNSPEPQPPSVFQAAAMISALPRPNQAYWTLSALWAGWLWGSEMTEPFKSVLRRRRYDWGWHCTALTAAFENLMPLLQAGAPAFALIGESEAGYLAAALLAGAATGLHMEGLAVRQSAAQAQIHWRKKQPDAVPADLLPGQYQEAVARKGNQVLHTHLLQRGEPAPFAQLHAVMIAENIQSQDFHLPAQLQAADVLSQTQTALLRAVQQNPGLVHLGGGERSIESGQWYLDRSVLAGIKPDGVATPLADRVEMSLVRYLIENPGCETQEVERAMLKQSPGLFTPEAEYLNICLASYGEKVETKDNRWVLRSQDSPNSRRSDILEINQQLEQIGGRLGYSLRRARPTASIGREALIWQDGSGEIEALFFVLASAVIGKVISQFDSYLQENRLTMPRMKALVVPGSRARLILSKIQNNLVLKTAVEDGWTFLKFRYMRRLAENDQITRAILSSQINQDPLANSDPQIPLW